MEEGPCAFCEGVWNFSDTPPASVGSITWNSPLVCNCGEMQWFLLGWHHCIRGAKPHLALMFYLFFFFNCLVIFANIVSREFEGCWSEISSCSGFIRFLHRGHVGLTNHHSLFLIVLLLFRGCTWGAGSRGAALPPTPDLWAQPCRAPSCSGPPIMTLTSQAGGLWVGVCGSLTVTQGLGPAGSALKPTLACGHSRRVAAFLPHTFTLMSAIKRCPRACPETTLSWGWRNCRDPQGHWVMLADWSHVSCLIDEHISNGNGDAMSGPGTQPCTHRGHSWSCLSPSCAHARYCPLLPPSPTFGPVWKPDPSSSVLGSLGSPGRQPEPQRGAKPGRSRCASPPCVLQANCGQHARPQAADHVALCLTTCQWKTLNSLEESGCGLASESFPVCSWVPSQGAGTWAAIVASFIAADLISS